VPAKLRYGGAKKASPKLLRKIREFLALAPVLSFDVPADHAYAAIRAKLESAG
jgi:tRNA(fMet)-specific endonuclease VapC